jgi:hypothetical protein
MNENSDAKKSGISKASTAEEIGEYWGNHSLADYWKQTHEVEVEVRAQRPGRVAVVEVRRKD